MPEQSKIGVKEFEKILREETKEVADDFGWDVDNQTDRGYAFQLWVANVLCDYDRGFDTEPQDAMLYTHDLKADLVLEDSNRQYLLIVQCMYSGFNEEVQHLGKRPGGCYSECLWREDTGI